MTSTRETTITTVKPDEHYPRSQPVWPWSEGIDPVEPAEYVRRHIMASPSPMLQDKHCLVYCGPERCNCIRGRGRQLPLHFETVFGVLLSPDPRMVVVLQINRLALATGGFVGTTPNYTEKLPPGASIRIEARRSPAGVVTYWPLGSQNVVEEATIAPFGPVFQTTTVRNRWQPMDTAPRDGTHILIWDGGEAIECFRGDGQRYPEDWIQVLGGPLMLEAEAWRHV